MVNVGGFGSDFIMGDAKAVNSSTEQAQSGIAPEAAGLEPECARPSPAKYESKRALSHYFASIERMRKKPQILVGEDV